ncbi:MAG: 5-(carboxyamino)imidazole ribonucleotide mutase [candidate division KSB1 bacterium]|nr:5-(carboxyamino)imidazole ribonucleotide mutase [candidate division KSB1 bacterium]
MKILSAHRTPDETVDFVKKSEEKGTEVFICGAGLSAHLPGVVASHTVLPVIGIPFDVKLGGLDSLFSIVNMPPDIPVACVGIDSTKNAALLSIEILSIKYPELKEKLKKYRKKLKEKILSKNDNIKNAIENL